MMNKIFILLVSSIMIFTACSKKNLENKNQISSNIDFSKPVKGDWIIVNLGEEPKTLNPITATDAYESRINSFVMESLLDRDKETLQLKLLLADTYFISDNKLEYTFVLKKGIKWHNGIELTADDIIYSFEKINDPKVLAPHLRNYYQDVKQVIKTDTYTVKFICAKKYFMQLENLGGIPIVCKKVFDTGDDFNNHPANRKPIGTGSYIFEKWETGQKIILKKNPDYWGNKPYLNKIVFKFISDDVVSLQALKKGEVDFAGLRPFHWIKESKSKSFNEKFTKLEFYVQNFNYIGWNAKKPYFKDRKVRTAMSYFVNKKQILKEIYFGLGTITTGPFYVFSEAYDTTIQPIEFDMNKGKRLLEEAGWRDTNNNGIIDNNGIEFRFEFLIVPGYKPTEQLATILKENLKKAGIEMIIRQLEWATFLQRLDNKEFDAVTLAWSMGIEQDPYQIWHSSGANEQNSSNFVSFENKEADEIIEKAREEFDKDKRNAMYRRLHRIIHYEQPYTFLFCQKSLAAVDKRFQNIKTYKIRPGYEMCEWWVPAELQKYKE